jgi:hypothetical protein
MTGHSGFSPSCSNCELSAAGPKPQKSELRTTLGRVVVALRLKIFCLGGPGSSVGRPTWLLWCRSPRISRREHVPPREDLHHGHHPYLILREWGLCNSARLFHTWGLHKNPNFPNKLAATLGVKYSWKQWPRKGGSTERHAEDRSHVMETSWRQGLWETRIEEKWETSGRQVQIMQAKAPPRMGCKHKPRNASPEVQAKSWAQACKRFRGVRTPYHYR